MQSRAARAAKLALVEHFDNFAPLRNGLRQIANERGDWAGIPMPLEGERLVIEPRYPGAEGLSSIGKPEDEDTSDATMINEFWSSRLRSYVLIWREAGKLCWGKVPGIHHISMDMHTMGCAMAWGVEQESNATHLLAENVRHHQFKQYMLTGMFLETSQRSGVRYLFRRLRPTVAISAGDGDLRILACLCLHPIGYYARTWAGAMCPTDDVLAHLMMMRGDEHLYWKRANQIHPGRPEAGL